MLETQREMEEWRRIRKRFGTIAGTGINKLVGNLNDTLTVTFPREEFDTNYGVMIQPSWETMFYVTSKTTTSFTVHFHKKAGTTDFIDYIIFRTEDNAT